MQPGKFSPRGEDWIVRSIAELERKIRELKALVKTGADSAKPVSTAQQTALNLKANIASPAFTGTPTGITKTHVGLANVDNTADTDKPVSTLQQAALDGKAATIHAHAWPEITGKPLTFAPSAHAHQSSEISDATTVGRSVLTAVDAAAARAAIGAGTSNLAIGTTGTTAMAGNKTFAFSEITGLIGTSQLPPLAINDTFPVASQAAMLALTAQRGDVAIRSDLGKTYILSTDNPGTLADWLELVSSGAVTSVAGRAGAVVLARADVGLGNVDNTTDAAKPVSTLQQAALDGKAASVHSHPMTDLTGTLTPAQLPAATGTAAGSLSAADKALLDAATFGATGNTLAKRHSSGSIQVNTGTTGTDAANKAYVDKLGVFRAAGTVSVPVIAAGATTTVTITFPASRFTVAPILTMNTGDGHVTIGASTITATSATVTLCNYTAAASIASTGNWQAVQMTAAAAAG